jgi:Tol biopolymer transport system component
MVVVARRKTTTRKESRRRLRAGAIGCVALTVVLGSVPALAYYPRPGSTELLSVAGDGTGPAGGSFTASMSADGRYVAFESIASNIVPDDTNRVMDVFVPDRKRGVTERVSVASDGTEGNAASLFAAISADGRYVAYQSVASNLVADDTNAAGDVFVHDRETGVTERVSVSSDGTEGNAQSFRPAISADGRYVAFFSRASNLVPDDTNDAEDVFVHDRETGVTERVSIASDGTQGNGHSGGVSISADGRYVAFRSRASNLVPGDTNGTVDVFVHDRETGTTERVSVASDGRQSNEASLSPSISADGRYVAFYSLAWNLVPGDTNGAADVFVHDRETGTTERVSVASDGTEGDSSSFAWNPSLSADGRYVAFYSVASNLVPDDTNGAGDVFVHDRKTGETERVSVASDGAQGDEDSFWPSVSATGRYAVFQSQATNLVPGGTNRRWHIYARDRGPAVGVADISATVQDDQVSVSGWTGLSGRVLTSSADPDDDGAVGAKEAGAELVGTSLTYRPEQGDLLVRWQLASLPTLAAGGCFPLCQPVGVSAGTGVPGILYGFELDIGGALYEARALRAGATAVPPAAPHFSLYRCDPECTEQASLSGGIGTAGNEVRVAVPLGVLGADSGSTLTELRAYSALGEAAPGPLVTLDEAGLPDATVPAAQVSLGIAPAGAPEDEVDFDVPADLTEGRFSGSLDVSSLSPGDYEMWARACLGEVCGVASTAVVVAGEPVVERKDTKLELTVEGQGQNMTLKARLSELDSPSVAIAGRTIDFYSDSELIGTETTSSDGIATVPVPPGQRGANRTYEAIFEGDDLYARSSDRRPGRGEGRGDGHGTAHQSSRPYRGGVFPL